MGETASITPFSDLVGLPVSTHLLAILTTELQRLYPIIEAEKITLTESDLIAPSPVQALVLQLLCLAVLSMHGGVFVPALRRVEFKHPVVQLNWAGGSKDRFVLGEMGADFRRFVSYFHKLTFRKSSQNQGAIDLVLVGQWVQLMVGNTQILGTCNDRIEMLLRSDFDLLKTLADGVPPDFIFIIISALPVDQLNQLFMFLYPFFPSDLVVKMPEGNKINVCGLFQSPSHDVRYVMEKIQVYLKLYNASDLPIMRIITQTKTTLFLAELLKNKVVSAKVRENLLSIREQQILSRMRIYYLMSDVLNRLLNE